MLALSEMEKVFFEESIETEIINIGTKAVQALMQRLFYSSHFDKTMKIGAAFVCARRSGATSSFDVLNKFFTNCGMPVVSSQYWNNSHGWDAGEAIKDDEGLQTVSGLIFSGISE